MTSYRHNEFLHGKLDKVGKVNAKFVKFANFASAFFHLFDAIGGKIYALRLKNQNKPQKMRLKFAYMPQKLYLCSGF